MITNTYAKNLKVFSNAFEKQSARQLGAEARALLAQAEIAKQRTIPETIELGNIHSTRNAVDIFGRKTLLTLIFRHKYKDYGELDEHDIYANELALICDGRVISCYHIDNEKIYVITEADRSCTTVLLAYEY